MRSDFVPERIPDRLELLSRLERAAKRTAGSLDFLETSSAPPGRRPSAERNEPLCCRGAWAVCVAVWHPWPRRAERQKQIGRMAKRRITSGPFDGER